MPLIVLEIPRGERNSPKKENRRGKEWNARHHRAGDSDGFDANLGARYAGAIQRANIGCQEKISTGDRERS
jgi:hypothetical protein